MPADLHIHSTFSDGTDTPEKIIAAALAAGLTTIALTDHDNIDGVEAALAAGRAAGVEVIPGIEFTTESPSTEIHILGYFIDCYNEEFLNQLKIIQSSRVDRIAKITNKLNSLGVAIDKEEVLALSSGRSPGRPHVARALVKRGAVSSVKEAFNRYLDFRSPAYIPHYKLSPLEVIGLIRQAGGVPVFAHPVVSNCDGFIPEMAAAGLRGLETYYPGYSAEQSGRYAALAAKLGLIVTGGSDYHGANSGREIKLGDLLIPDEMIRILKDEHLRRN